MGGHIFQPHYQEKSEIRHYRTKKERHVRRLENYRSFLKKVQKPKYNICLCKPRETLRAMGLEELPAEVLENTLSYLTSPLACYSENPTPKSSNELKSLHNLSDYRIVLEHHPFYRLAATCHTLRSVVESFSQHLLHRYENILCFEILESGLTMEEWSDRIKQRKRINSEASQPSERMDILPPFRLMWVRWSYCHCLFCGRQTNRRAIFNHFIYVCHKCDKMEWPKLKRKEILAHKILLPIHLNNPRHLFPNSNLEAPRFAYEWTHGPLYLASDIEALTSYVCEHDPDGIISKAAQKKKDATLVIKTFDGKTIELDT